MSELISRVKIDMGNLTRISETYRDKNQVLRDGYVQACMIVIDTYTANKLIRAGFASGWRYLVKKDGFCELWAPPVGKPVKYIIQNAVFSRALTARGSGLIKREERTNGSTRPT